MRLLKSTLVFSSMTLLSRVAGYVRDLVQASVFGATAGMDAFLIAYRIPNFLRRIFAEGSFAQAFVPVFTEYRQKGDEAALKSLLDHVAGALCAVVLAVTAIGILVAPAIVALFAPGSLDEPVKFGLTTEMLRITFPYLFFISLTALAGGVLNSYGRFAVPALTPVLHNLAVIAAALWLAPLLDMSITALAWGVFAAGVVQLLVQFIALAKLGVVPRFRLDTKHEGVRKVFRLMLPTLFSSSVAQVNLIVGTMFASLLATGSQTWLYLTDRLLEFPLGIFGVALGTVILPHLSRNHAAADPAAFSRTIVWGLRMALLVALPATAALIVLAEPINATLYQYGRFTAHDTNMAALSLMGLALGLPGFMLSKILAPAFYARQDTKTPMRAAITTVVINLVLTLAITTPLWWFEVPGAHAGIALASGLAGLANAALLFAALKRQGLMEPGGWPRFLARTGFATVAMGTALFAVQQWTGPFSAMSPQPRVAWMGAVVVGGAAIYGIVLLAAGLRPRHLRER